MFRSRFLLILGTIASLLICLHSCSWISNQTNQTSSSSTNILTNVDSIEQNNGDIFAKEVDSPVKNISTDHPITDSIVFSDLSVSYDLQKSELLTDTGKLLAGMQIGDRSKLATIKNTTSWLNHRQFMTNSWKKLEEKQLSKIKQWQKRTIHELEDLESTVFYPFSNSNFIYAYSLFPQSQEFMLFGLEPIGNLPEFQNMKEQELEREFKTIKNSLDAIFPQKYFDGDERQNIQTHFVLPVLCVFLARSHNRIINIENIGINNEGKLQSWQAGMIPGVKITFMIYGESNPKFLYYFSTELSNETLDNYPEISKFINTQNNLFTYLNAASYLMHFDSFSEIRKLILSQSNYVLQDDSGLPINAFEKDIWNLEFYGNYVRPIALFEDKYQSQLWQIYHSQRNIEPLNFTIGYQHDRESSNLMLAKTKNNSK
ncbi:MAG: hypothetical protein Tsb0014_23150 [Pleurocapsa sp.]